MDSCKSLGIQTSIGRAAWGFHKEKVWQSQNEPSAVLDSSIMQPSLPTLGVRGSSPTPTLALNTKVVLAPQVLSILAVFLNIAVYHSLKENDKSS